MDHNSVIILQNQHIILEEPIDNFIKSWERNK